MSAKIPPGKVIETGEMLNGTHVKFLVRQPQDETDFLVLVHTLLRDLVERVSELHPQPTDRLSRAMREVTWAQLDMIEAYIHQHTEKHEDISTGRPPASPDS